MMGLSGVDAQRANRKTESGSFPSSFAFLQMQTPSTS